MKCGVEIHKHVNYPRFTFLGHLPPVCYDFFLKPLTIMLIDILQ